MIRPLPAEWDGWLREGARLAAAPPLRRSDQLKLGPSDPKFAFGDYLLNIPEEFLEQYAGVLGEDFAKLRIYREVAELIPPDRRVAASWTVHRDLRAKPALLRDGLTVRDAAALAGKKPIDSKSDQRLTVAEKAAKVRAFLDDKQVYALIELEMTQSRRERSSRKARIVHGELAAQQKDLEAEVRAMRESKSPFEATVDAELKLNNAAQLVHAVGETLAGLPQPERLTAVLHELGEQVRDVLGKHADVERAGYDNGLVVDAEMWRDKPGRAALASSNQRFSSTGGRVVDQDD